MEVYVLRFPHIDSSHLLQVGGKGANLGEMTQAGFPVPDGFCVTTKAYEELIVNSEEMHMFWDRLAELTIEDQSAIQALGKEIRKYIRQVPIPPDIRTAILTAWKDTDVTAAYAVRSSATAEDLPSASFAGQQDSYLNVIGEESLIAAVQQCWASLFTDRAISYRIKNEFSHQTVALAVVVQKMVFPDVSGILFTADPITGHRQIVSIDAGFGLGEALVSGITNADLYQVQKGKVIKKQIAHKQKAIFALPEGGTKTVELPSEQQQSPALNEKQVLQLADLGKQVEAHYGTPQDIEWALWNDEWYVLQARPITSLYPIPTKKDEQLHCYVSFGHVQMMTDAMKPLATSLWRTLFPVGKQNAIEESESMQVVGNRIFLDITPILQSKLLQKRLPLVIQNVDYLLSDAIKQFVQKDVYNQQNHLPLKTITKAIRILHPTARRIVRNMLWGDPDIFAREVNDYLERLVMQSKKELDQLRGAQRIQFIRENSSQLLGHMLHHVIPYIFPGLFASIQLRKMLSEWVGNDEALDILNQSLEGNVTSEMGLELADVAELARPFPELVNHLEQSTHKSNWLELESCSTFEGGVPFVEGFTQYLQKYGMRCPGEIDITRPRWNEEPQSLLPSILSHLKQMTANQHRERFTQGEIQAEKTMNELLITVSNQENGKQKSKKLKRLVKLFRSCMALREHHKFAMIRHFGFYKEVILEEAALLVEKGILQQTEDVYFLKLDELQTAISGIPLVHAPELIKARRESFKLNQKKKPPRVFTSEGEIIVGQRKNTPIPKGALAGTPVSSGIIEGTARVVFHPDQAKMEAGDILVAPFTDPGWTPLFLSAKGLVLEVGGLMTHGAVIAREYGIPAVVGVEGATETIRNGQRIRVNGREGYVELLEK